MFFSLFRSLFLSSIAISFSFANTTFYSISVCTSDNYKDALRCKNLISKKAETEIYIIQSDDLKYRTTYGTFDSYTKIKQFQKNLPKVIVVQKPFVQNFNLSDNSIKFIEKYPFENLSTPIKIEINKEKIIPKTTQIIELQEDTQSISDLKNKPKVENNSTKIELTITKLDGVEPNNEEESENFFDSIVLFLKESFGLPQENKEPRAQQIDSLDTTVQTNDSASIQITNIKNEDLFLQPIESSPKENLTKTSDKNTTIETPKEPITAQKKDHEKLVAVIQHNTPQKIKIKKTPSTPSTISAPTPTITQVQAPKSNLVSNEGLNQYDQLILLVDSAINKMYLQGKKGGDIITLNEFIVSTARQGALKPEGEGKITAISLAPIWYPTKKTIEYFKEKKGIELPSAVLPGDKRNYMGAAKINLSHNVNGKNIYRIHGTLNEKTIGTKESSGCIRMKNKEVLALAKMLKQFALKKGSLESVKVILK